MTLQILVQGNDINGFEGIWIMSIAPPINTIDIKSLEFSFFVFFIPMNFSA